MSSFKNLSIRSKLVALIMAAVFVALLIAIIAFIAYSLNISRNTLKADTETLAQIIGINSTAAVVFNDQNDAYEILRALKAKPSIAIAAIYKSDNELFASYVRDDLKGKIELPVFVKSKTSHFDFQYLYISRAIYQDKEQIGVVYIQSDLRDIYDIFWQNLFSGFIILLLCFIIAYILSSNFSAIIAKPITSLVETAKIVSEKKDYSVRGQKHGSDEVGLLIDAFNEMLDQIQQRNTELIKLNEELEARVTERTSALMAVNRELEAFSYSVSHDLRAPLRGIDGFSKILLEDYSEKLDEDGKNHLNRVRAASQRMSELIDALLQLSRITRGEINKEEVNLTSLVKNIVSDLSKRDPQRKVDTVIQEGVTTVGDARLLRAVLENLLNNAWKFTSKKEYARIEFGNKKVDGKDAYFIRDNGAGFDMAYADKLFGAFQRLHALKEFEGNGIGLATVQRIIHRHGGRIWAEAEINAGATFYFTLSS